MRTLFLRLGIVALGITSIVASPGTVDAQIDPTIRDQVIAAAVQIAVIVEVTDNGTTEASYIPVGSGTVVSPGGLILTNAHVVDMDAHAEQLRVWEQQASDHGDVLNLALIDDRFLVLGSDGASPAKPAFFALVLELDRDLDLAILQVKENADGEAVAGEDLTLPSVPLGDSDSAQLGDPIDVFGYPVVGGDSLTYTTGVVSGFNFEAPSERRAWITTDATLSGGSSGGTAVNRHGELIGVPTQGSELDCRPGDTNLDGEISVEDVGCVPVGGSIGLVRPINLARGLLDRAGFDRTAAQVRGSDPFGEAHGYAPPPEAPTPAGQGGGISGAAGYVPTPNAPVATESGSFTQSSNKAQDAQPESSEGSAFDAYETPPPSGNYFVDTFDPPSSAPGEIKAAAARQNAVCASSPIYPVGTSVVTLSLWPMLLASGEDRFPGRDEIDAMVPASSVVRITGPLVERGICDGWPVEVISTGASVNLGSAVARVGDLGVIGEQAFQVPA